MLPETSIRLANDFDNIVGVKEACGDMVQVQELIKNKPDGFHVISGDDITALSTTLAGGSGVISVLGQGLPVEFSNMIRAALNRDVDAAYELHYALQEGMDLIFKEGNPAGIKSIFETLRLSTAIVRLPLIEATDELKEKIRNFAAPFIEVTA